MNIYEIAFLFGRFLLGGYFLMNAINHFTKTEMMAGYAKSKGVPMPQMAVLGSGFLLLAGALSILSGVVVVWGILALVLFLVPVTLQMHQFWKATEPMAKMSEMINFTKNLALLGALLMLLMIPTPWLFSLKF